MLSQIRQQLAQNWKDDLHHSVSSVAASPLNRQLSYQTEYNTNLLSQLEGLEKENQQLRSRLAAADAVQGEWREGSREAEQRVEDLHRKLTISSQLCDRLSQQCSELRDTNGRLEMQSEDSSQELVALREKHRDALEHSARLDIRVQELEHRLGFSEAGRLWEGGEERARAGALDLSLQRCTQELADAHARAAGLERELSALSEENMDLRRQADRAHQATERETEARQSLQGNLAAVTSELHQLKIHSRQLELDRKESIESNEVRRLEMSYADRAQHLAAEMSHRADEKWRQLEVSDCTCGPHKLSLTTSMW